jgi:serine/threonine protein kinase
MPSKLPKPWKPVPGTNPPPSGQGYVFQVQREGETETYALKRLKNNGNPLRVKRFHREVETMKTLASIGYPVPQVVAEGLDDDQPWFVMPWYSKGSLQDLIGPEASDIGVVDRLRLAAQVADALALIHQRELAHRDIKPANILLDGEKVLLADFGLCISVDDPRLTETGEPIGPRFYMAPENESGISEEVDQRPGDCYSWAKLAWAVVAAQNPPAREDILKPALQLHRILDDDRLQGLHHLFERTLVTDPRTRLTDWIAIRSDLKFILGLYDPDSEKESAEDSEIDEFEEALRAAAKVATDQGVARRQMARAKMERRQTSARQIEQILNDEIPASVKNELDSLRTASSGEIVSSISTGGFPFYEIMHTYDFGLDYESDGERYDFHSDSQAAFHLRWSMPEDLHLHQNWIDIGVYVVVQGDSFHLIRTPVTITPDGPAAYELFPGSIKVSSPLALGLSSSENEAKIFAQEAARMYRHIAAVGVQLISRGINPRDPDSWR